MHNNQIKFNQVATVKNVVKIDDFYLDSPEHFALSNRRDVQFRTYLN